MKKVLLVYAILLIVLFSCQRRYNCCIEDEIVLGYVKANSQIEADKKCKKKNSSKACI